MRVLARLLGVSSLVGERRTEDAEVAGSSPAWPTFQDTWLVSHFLGYIIDTARNQKSSYDHQDLNW